MNKKLLVLLLFSAVLFSSCAEKNPEYIPDSKNPTIDICSFEDFRYLMFTENGVSVIRDSDGNEYTLGYDGYYYDNDGNRITVYGAGDSETVRLGASTGAIMKSDKDLYSDKSNSASANNNSNSGEKDSNKVSNDTSGVVEVGDSENGEIIIKDWESFKSDIMEDAGILQNDEDTWHNHDDDMEHLKASSGDSKVTSNTEYQTNIDFGDSIPASINFGTVQDTGKGKVSGIITLDGNAYIAYAKSVLGDTQIDENGQEVEADYSELLIDKTCDVYMYATDGYNNVLSNVCTVTFDENYIGTFEVSCDIPENYTAYLVVNGVTYNI